MYMAGRYYIVSLSFVMWVAAEQYFIFNMWAETNKVYNFGQKIQSAIYVLHTHTKQHLCVSGGCACVLCYRVYAYARVCSFFFPIYKEMRRRSRPMSVGNSNNGQQLKNLLSFLVVWAFFGFFFFFHFRSGCLCFMVNLHADWIVVCGFTMFFRVENDNMQLLNKII